MLKKIRLLINTVKYLKAVQILYQVYYRLKPVKKLTSYLPNSGEENTIQFLSFTGKLYLNINANPNGEFEFLNLHKKFSDEIDWNFQGHGKLWNYNLQYFAYLSNDSLSEEVKIKWLKDIGLWLREGKLNLEPYPTSLRIMNSIRFFSQSKVKDEQLLAELFAQLNYLQQRLEYHLLGNHLLENAFALLMGGHFYNQPTWIKKAEEILSKELDEQILDDGSHFELSPMYHQIILFRILELIDWHGKIEKNHNFLKFLIGKAKMMLSFLKEITFLNGDIPHFSDSAKNISASSNDLFSYAGILNLDDFPKLDLRSSGFRRFDHAKFECIVDCGAIGPLYQPAHGHADALSFILYANNKPFLVETGTSTYQIGEKRNFERSTAAHNTVVVAQSNQSQVWGGFRVGNRANVTIVKEDNSILSASHDGYFKRFNVIHERQFDFLDDEIIIKDALGNGSGVAYFHFHPNLKLTLLETNLIAVAKIATIEFIGSTNLSVEDYEYANGYNNYLIGEKIAVTFAETLLSTIKFELIK